MNKKQKIIMIATILLFIVYLGISFLFEKEDKVEAKESTIPVVEKVQEEPIIELYKVDIKGQVEKPGVYEVSKDSRVIDVVELAGGLKKDANTDFINLSKKVEDGSVIWIYTTKEIEKLTEVKTVTEYIEKECNCPDVSNSACVTKPSTNSNTDTKDTITGKININTASLEELTSLNGVGESKAKAIIEYRTKNPFKSIEDVKNVSGIGDSAYEKIKDSITV